MKCPRCGASYDLERIQFISDEINRFGRRELTFRAEGSSWITWDPKEKKYSCLKCHFKFSYQEAVLQCGQKKISR